MASDLSVALKITGDARSAVAALEETRKAQLNAFKGGKDAAAEAAGRWKAAEAEVRRLATAARAGGADQASLAAKIRAASAEAARAKQAWQDETAALHRRRQALAENKAALEQMAAASRAASSGGAGSGISVDAARSTLGLIPHAQIKQQIDQVRQSYAALAASGKLSGAELSQAAAAARARVAQLSAEMRGAQTAGTGMGGALSVAGRAISALAAISAGVAILRLADDMALLRARLTLVEGSAEGAQAALGALSGIAARAQTPVQAVAGSYNKMAQSIYNLGGSQQDALGLTESLALALRVSGASAQESASVMLQLGQAMQKGSLNGDEFVSVAESGGKVLDYLAEALGVSRGELRRMSTEGELGADKLMRLTTVLEKIRADAAALPQTVGGAVTYLNSKWAEFVDRSEAVRLASAGVAGVLKLIADNIEGIAWAGAVGGAILLASQLGRLRLAAQAALAVMALSSFTPVGMALRALALAAGFAAGKWIEAGDASETGSGRMVINAKRAEDATRALGAGAKAAGDKIKEALDEAGKRSERLVGELQTHGKQAADNARSQYDARIAAIENFYGRKKTELDNSHASEDTKVRESARLVAEAERDKLAAVREWADGAEREVVSFYDEAIRLARANGGDVEQLEREKLLTLSGLYTQREAAYKTTIDKLIAEEQRLAGEVKRIEQERYLLKLSTEDRIRALKQGAMGSAEAYADRERQIAEKLAAAQTALQRGNFEDAKRLAEQAMSLAERNAGAVTRSVERNGKSVTETVVSQATASGKAIENIGKASTLVDKALAGMGGAAKSAMQTVGGEAREAERGMEGVTAELGRLRQALADKIALQIEVDKEAVRQAAQEAEDLVRAQKLAAEMQLRIGGVEDALADLKKATDASEAAQLRLKATADVESFTQGLVELQQIAIRQKLELPAQLQEEPALQSIERLKKHLGAPTTATHTPQPDLSRHRQAVAELQRPTSSQHTIYVRRVEQHAIGGLVGMSAGVARLATGGALPGYGGGDRIRALLEAGEFVVRKEAVRYYGLDTLAALNGMRLPLPAYAVGGLAGLPPMAAAAGGPAAATPSGGVVEINVNIGRERIRLSGARDQAMALAGALRELSRGV